MAIGKVKGLLSGSGKDNAPEAVNDTLPAADDLLGALSGLNSSKRISSACPGCLIRTIFTHPRSLKPCAVPNLKNNKEELSCS
ncbi:hypothetical protein [uncultured Desulfobacter sp.]|uniref:hypothetical protein n=1 Tax=uncultured Desulfobacter sp. TaxID=240139 RepID=UPI002AAA9165|nr:hypothetical protein [uncultured Desulfobacter sp.]